MSNPNQSGTTPARPSGRARRIITVCAWVVVLGLVGLIGWYGFTAKSPTPTPTADTSIDQEVPVVDGLSWTGLNPAQIDALRGCPSNQQILQGSSPIDPSALRPCLTSMVRGTIRSDAFTYASGSGGEGGEGGQRPFEVKRGQISADAAGDRRIFEVSGTGSYVVFAVVVRSAPAVVGEPMWTPWYLTYPDRISAQDSYIHEVVIVGYDQTAPPAQRNLDPSSVPFDWRTIMRQMFNDGPHS